MGIAHDRWLIYGKAGVAWSHSDYTDNWTIVGVPLFTGTGSENRVGWTVGTGIEWAIWNNWSIKAEYDYLDFGNRTVAINGAILPGIANIPASFGLETSCRSPSPRNRFSCVPRSCLSMTTRHSFHASLSAH